MVFVLDNLIIRKKLEDVIEYAYCVFRHFPKSERFTLVADMKRSLVKMLELIIRANNWASFLGYMKHCSGMMTVRAAGREMKIKST
jgi:hypothetical protein